LRGREIPAPGLDPPAFGAPAMITTPSLLRSSRRATLLDQGTTMRRLLRRLRLCSRRHPTLFARAALIVLLLIHGALLIWPWFRGIISEDGLALSPKIRARLPLDDISRDG